MKIKSIEDVKVNDIVRRRTSPKSKISGRVFSVNKNDGQVRVTWLSGLRSGTRTSNHFTRLVLVEIAERATPATDNPAPDAGAETETAAPVAENWLSKAREQQNAKFIGRGRPAAAPAPDVYYCAECRSQYAEITPQGIHCKTCGQVGGSYYTQWPNSWGNQARYQKDGSSEEPAGLE